MKDVMLDVVDLAVSRPKDVARIENMASDRLKLQNQISAKLDTAAQEQTKCLQTLSAVRNDQITLEFKG